MPEVKERDIVSAVVQVLELCLDDDFDEDDFRVSGSFQEGVLSVRVEAPESEQANLALLEVFYDLFYELELEEDAEYHFHWLTEQHETYLQTQLSLMPDTGEVTAESWAAFVEQLVYEKDGEPQELPEPDEFYL